MGSKRFAFKNVLTCGQCGGAIVAQEKYKKLKNGSFNRHVYYNYNRHIDPNSNEPYINEISLQSLLQKFIEENYNNILLSAKLQAVVDRHFAATKELMAHYKIKRTLSVPVVEYARYALLRGTESEPISLSEGIDTTLYIEQGKLTT